MSANPNQTPAAPRWNCPECESTDVQVSYPTWYRETNDYSLEFVETDSEAEILYWFCPACEESGHGEPHEVQQ